MGLRRYAVLSGNGLHTTCHKTDICLFFARTQRELGVSVVLCSPQVRGKLIYHVCSTNCSQTIWFAYEYQPLHLKKRQEYLEQRYTLEFCTKFKKPDQESKDMLQQAYVTIQGETNLMCQHSGFTFFQNFILRTLKIE